MTATRCCTVDVIEIVLLGGRGPVCTVPPVAGRRQATIGYSEFVPCGLVGLRRAFYVRWTSRRHPS